MANLEGRLGSAAHLCIDMQRLFSPGGPWATPWMDRVLPQVVRLVEHTPARTVFTRFLTPRRADEMPGMWRAYYQKWQNVTRERMDPTLLDLVPALQVYTPPAAVFDKFVYSAFHTGMLHKFLRQRNVETLIVTGSETDVCVLSTVLAAIDLGYRVVVARDGVCSSTDEGHDAITMMYEKRFDLQVVLADVDEILAAWKVD